MISSSGNSIFSALLNICSHSLSTNETMSIAPDFSSKSICVRKWLRWNSPSFRMISSMKASRGFILFFEIFDDVSERDNCPDAIEDEERIRITRIRVYSEEYSTAKIYSVVFDVAIHPPMCLLHKKREQEEKTSECSENEKNIHTVEFRQAMLLRLVLLFHALP